MKFSHHCPHSLSIIDLQDGEAIIRIGRIAAWRSIVCCHNCGEIIDVEERVIRRAWWFMLGGWSRWYGETHLNGAHYP